MSTHNTPPSLVREVVAPYLHRRQEDGTWVTFHNGDGWYWVQRFWSDGSWDLRKAQGTDLNSTVEIGWDTSDPAGNNVLSDNANPPT